MAARCLAVTAARQQDHSQENPVEWIKAGRILCRWDPVLPWPYADVDLYLPADYDSVGARRGTAVGREVATLATSADLVVAGGILPVGIWQRHSEF